MNGQVTQPDGRPSTVVRAHEGQGAPTERAADDPVARSHPAGDAARASERDGRPPGQPGTESADGAAFPLWLRKAALPISVALVLGQLVVLGVWSDAHTLLIDLQVYRAGGAHVPAGLPLFDGGVLLDLPFVYPPFAAVLFVPLTLLPLTVLKLVWTAAGLAALVFAVQRSARTVGRRLPPEVVVLLVAVGLSLDPVRTTLYLGQINLLLLALVLADLTGRPESRWRGVGVGLAVSIKLTPLVFVGYLLLTRRFRAAGTALATATAATALGFLAAPRDSVEYWLRGTFAAAGRISDIAATSNHSVNGLLARALGEGAAQRWAFLAAAALLGAWTLALAVRAHRRADELAALALCGLASAALAPFAWSHHWVWFVPLLVLLVHRACLRTGSHRALLLAAVVLVVTVAIITRPPGPGVGPIPATGLISLWPDAYLAVFLLLLTAGINFRPAALRLVHRRAGGT